MINNDNFSDDFLNINWETIMQNKNTETKMEILIKTTNDLIRNMLLLEIQIPRKIHH